MLSRLPSASVATHEEVLLFINGVSLFGRGVGYVDVHLLAAVRLTAGSQLWTLDKRLNDVAAQLGMAAGAYSGGAASLAGALPLTNEAWQIGA